jgi:polysaccharide export outer membrane protein
LASAASLLLTLAVLQTHALADTPAAGTAPAATTAAVGEQYIIGPGDSLRLFVLDSPDLSAEVPVRPDGKISAPLVSDIVAAGKTATQLANDLQEALKQYVRQPTVSVIIQQAVSTNSQVQVIGQAVTPRAIPFHEGMHVLEAIIGVGGLSRFAAGNKAKIVRQEGGKVRELRVRLDDLINRGDVSQNFELRAGDLLVIPEAWF